MGLFVVEASGRPDGEPVICAGCCKVTTASPRMWDVREQADKTGNESVIFCRDCMGALIAVALLQS